jgi:hypothetical protein
MTPKKVPTFQEGDIDTFIRRRVCARCYHDLEKKLADDRMYEAVCPICEGAWGYATVSRKYAESLGQKALADYFIVRENLPDLFPRQKRTEKQLLSSLGF